MVKKAALFLSLISTTLCFSGEKGNLLKLNPSALRDNSVDTSQLNKPATVKVLLDKEVNSALVEIRGKHKIFNPVDNTLVAQATHGKIAPLTHYIGGIRWNEDYPEAFQIRLVPENENTCFYYNGIQYRGTLEVYSIQGKLTFINEIDAESFLKTQITDHYPESIQREVADALAIVERTNLYYHINNNSGVFYHYTRDEIGYKGMINQAHNPKVDHAVDVTSQMVLTLNGRSFPTEWNENCAGRTTSLSSAYRKNVSTPDGIDSLFAQRDRSKAEWNYTISLETIGNKLDMHNVKSVDLFEDQKSQKVYAVRISNEHDHKDIDFVHFEKLFGKQNIQSNDFHATIKDGKVHLQGYGKGHGVGLCLYSANHLSKEGKSAIQILEKFYPGTKLQKRRQPL